MLGIKNDDYSITMELDINHDFKDGTLLSVFDIKKDRFCFPI